MTPSLAILLYSTLLLLTVIYIQVPQLAMLLAIICTAILTIWIVLYLILHWIDLSHHKELNK